jgi:hypothetical protein
MQNMSWFRFARQGLWIGALLLLFVGYLGISKYQVNQNQEDGLPASKLAPDDIQKQVAAAVGTTPGLSELFVSQMADGSFMVHGTVEDATASTDLSGDSNAHEYDAIGFQFMNQVYGLKLPIKSAELYIVEDNHMVFGMGIGDKYKGLITSVPVSSGEDKQAVIIQTIQKINNQDESHPEQMAWIETLS